MYRYLLLLLFNASLLNAQNFEWARGIGGSSGDIGNAITFDYSGNVYVAGFFNGTANFGGATLNSVRDANAFLAKYSPNGSLQWVRQVKGYSENLSIASDSTGIYCAGSYADTVVMEGGASSNVTLTNSGSYLAKYDLAGNLLWVNRAFTGGNGSIFRLATSNGAICVAGNFDRYITLSGASGNTTLNSSDGNSPGIFVGKYDRNGDIVWAKQASGICPIPCGQGGNPNLIRITSLSMDSNGNAYLLGNLVGTIDFGTSSHSSANGAVYFAKYLSDGTFAWVKDESGTQYWDLSYDLVCDNSANIYVAGRNSAFHFFLSKYDLNGNLLWSITDSNPMMTAGYDLNTDSQGNVLIAGNFKGNMGIGGCAFSSGNYETFLVSLTPGGVFDWGIISNNLGGGAIGALGIAHPNNSNNYYLTGYTRANVQFGDSVVHGDMYNQIFIAKVNAGSIAGMPSINSNTCSLTVFPNPSSGSIFINYVAKQAENLTLQLRNELGQTILVKNYLDQSSINETIDVGKLNKGVYFIEVRSPKISEIRKVVIQ